MDKPRSWEYASWIIEAREKDSPFRIHGNVMNSTDGRDALISNLAADGCVEVACMVDRNGINPTRYGALPSQMAALCASNLAVFDLGATAAIERNKEAAIRCPDARSADRSRLQPGRDQEDDAGAFRGGEGVSSQVSLTTCGLALAGDAFQAQPSASGDRRAAKLYAA